MLSPQSASTIRVTLPAVDGAIGEIAPLFYEKLFAAHPELLHDLFNRGNQANGEQQKALAGAVVAFARALLDHPDVRPDVMLQRIAHKHASLGISRDQYPVVRTHLFAALAQVLGDAATEEVVAAWDEVYWLMAHALAAIEDRLYAEAGARDGGVWHEVLVVGRQPETGDVTTFVVAAADGTELPPARPGQYVSVQVELADGARQIRQYSLTGTGDGTLRFAVKRIAGTSGRPDGEVSNHLHAHVREGDPLRLSAPFGDVFLAEDDDRPVLLASAGIGCTPMIGMLGHLAATGSQRPVVAVHADRSPHTHALRGDLDQLVAKLPQASAHVWYEEPGDGWPADRTGLADLGAVPLPGHPQAPGELVAYLCGPLPFLRAARTRLLERSVRAEDIHYEVFGPDLWLGGEATA